MMTFKACPRCQGDLYQEEAFGERELVCLQCGRRVALDRQMARKILEGAQTGIGRRSTVVDRDFTG
jgi:hypothetical protein